MASKSLTRNAILRSNDVVLLKRELKKAWARGDAVLGDPEALAKGTASVNEDDASNPNQIEDFRRLSTEAKKVNFTR